LERDETGSGLFYVISYKNHPFPFTAQIKYNITHVFSGNIYTVKKEAMSPYLKNASNPI
jgi:hypothetical protein